MGNISSVWHQKQKVRARIFSACNNITSIAVGATFAIQCTWSEVCAGWMGKWSLVLFLTKCCHGRSLTIWLQNHASVHAEWRLFFAVIFATIIAFFSSAKSYMINCTQSTLGIRAVVRGGDGLWVQPPIQIMTKITDQSVQLVQFFHFTPPKGVCLPILCWTPPPNKIPGKLATALNWYQDKYRISVALAYPDGG